MKIDLVIPYVNNKDTVWRNTYIDYCDKNKCAEKLVNLVGARYGGLDFLDYHLKLANKNMKWINKIYLLLSNKEQIKGKKLPKNVEVVLHKDFIWQSFLPTFNSTTIEMFLWNIPNLSEYFIYANDDMLPLNPLKEEDFFQDGKIKMNFKKESIMEHKNIFRHQCMNGYNLIRKMYGLSPSLDIYIRPIHSFTPMIKSNNELVMKTMGEDIYPFIKAYRTEEQYNQYIYPLREFISDNSLDSQVKFLYTELKDINDIENLGHYDIVCINIVPNEKVGKLLINKLGQLL